MELATFWLLEVKIIWQPCLQVWKWLAKGFGREARYATVSFEQHRYSVFENHVMRKKSTYDNKLTISNNIVRSCDNCGVVEGLEWWRGWNAGVAFGGTG